MASSDELTAELLTYIPNVYFQPPDTITLTYPCIVYNRSDKDKLYGNDGTYRSIQGYNLTVIELDPESDLADRLDNDLQYCSINQYFITDGLYHTTLSLYY